VVTDIVEGNVKVDEFGVEGESFAPSVAQDGFSWFFYVVPFSDPISCFFSQHRFLLGIQWWRL